ncbi:MAG TPA: gamma carbonic anhydrase family protein [Burkholderiaceae bacterium]|nr:gamma carbonic anhydrase family protein [Burkholderiaceae bacterium]
MAIYQYDGRTPEIGPDVYVAEAATVLGRVRLGARTNVWFGAVIRGDNDDITIGDGCNVQDGAILHVDPGFPMQLGDNVSVGHQAMLHGCTVGDRTLIGIQAVVMNKAVIGEDCLVGAGALVTEGKQFPPRSLILGSPAKVARELTESELGLLKRAAESYMTRAVKYRDSLQRIDHVVPDHKP